MILVHDSPLVRLLGRMLIPVIQIYAVYVLFHSQYSPGGGFVSGVLIAASLILTVMIFGVGPVTGFIENLAHRAEGLGLLVFGGIGAVCLIGGGVFLDYSGLAVFGLDGSARRSAGIIGTQIGVAVDVAVVAISIFFNLSPRYPKETAGD